MRRARWRLGGGSSPARRRWRSRGRGGFGLVGLFVCFAFCSGFFVSLVFFGGFGEKEIRLSRLVSRWDGDRIWLKVGKWILQLP